MKPSYKPYSNPTQLFGIATDGDEAVGKLLIALPTELSTATAFKGLAASITVWHQDWSLASQEESQFEVDPPQGPFDLVLLYLPKGIESQARILDALSSVIKSGGRLIVCGEKQSGINSAKVLLEKYCNSAPAKHSARHCIAWDLRIDRPSPMPAREFTSFKVEAWGQSLEVASLPGVFAHGHMDEATAFLTETLDLKKMEFRKVLDWGCGAGVIGSLIRKDRKTSHVTLADSSVLAVESSRETLKRNGIEDVEVIATDGWSELGAERYDMIITNPPAHKGFKTDRSASEAFLTEAPKHLRPGGRLILVANGHLPYIPVLAKVFDKVRVVNKNARFQVLEGLL